MSNLVVENQKAYAEKYGYDYKAFTRNLASECYDSNEHIEECQPYWNKIAIVRNWLIKGPLKEDSEQWLLWLDDDMPITNFQYSVEDIIQKFQGPEHNRASIIVTLDSRNWHHDSKETSVNTGALFVRRTPQAKEVINKIWRARNKKIFLGNAWTTLGGCKDQECLHEQEALADLLKDEPELVIDGHIVVIEPYASGFGINGLARKGRFINERNRWKVIYEDEDLPERVWRSGDFSGQCSGVPTWGCRALDGSSKDETWYCDGPVQNMRLLCIKDLIDQVVLTPQWDLFRAIGRTLGFNNLIRIIRRLGF